MRKVRLAQVMPAICCPTGKGTSFLCALHWHGEPWASWHRVLNASHGHLGSSWTSYPLLLLQIWKRGRDIGNSQRIHTSRWILEVQSNAVAPSAGLWYLLTLFSYQKTLETMIWVGSRALQEKQSLLFVRSRQKGFNEIKWMLLRLLWIWSVERRLRKLK